MQLPHVIFALAFILMKTVVVAQTSPLRAYTTADGLPQSQIYDLEQDEQGYLWIATYGTGICRFDGEQFEIWNNKQQLASNFVNAIKSVGDHLYIATRKGIAIKTGNAVVHIEGPEILKIYEIDTEIYLATAKGLFRLANKTIKRQKLHEELDQRRINDLVYDGKFYWLATDNGLWRLENLDSNRTEAQKVTTNNFTALAYSDPHIFAATYDDGTLVFDRNGNHHDPILIREPLRISDIAIVNDTELWIATDNNGITIIDTQTYAEKSQIDRKSGLQVLHVKKIIAINGTTWIATLGGGFYKYFDNNFTHYDRDSGLQNNRIEAVHATKDAVWIANATAKLAYIDTKGIQDVPLSPQFSETKITSITSDINDRLWVATDSRGMMLRAPSTMYTVQKDSTFVASTSSYTTTLDTLVQRTIKNYTVDQSKGLLSDRIRLIEADRDGTLWAATFSKGITHFRYNAAIDSVISLENFNTSNGLPSKDIQVIKKDPTGILWYGTTSGQLGCIKGNKVVHLGTVVPQEHAISTLCFNSENIFIGTAGGGIWTAPIAKELIFRSIVGKEKYNASTINQLIVDDEGALWAGTERGVDKIRLDENAAIIAVTHFGKEDGFLGVETIPNAIAKDSNGSLWFGSNYGLTKYTPGNVTKKDISGKLHFTQIQIGYQSLDTLNFRKWTNSERVLQLSSEETQLSFAYKTVAIDHPKMVRYRIRLNEEEWSPWGTENKQNFSGLRYGSHVFQVQSKSFGLEESTPIQFQFYITPPWHKKPWFPWAFAGMALVLLGIVGLFYIKRIQKRNREAQEKLRLQNEVLALEQKALRLQMNPHFVFNVLNGIKAMGLHDPQKMNRTINTFATLLRETLYNSRKEKITLEQEIKTLHNYIGVERLMTDSAFTYEITTELEMEAEEILLPPMLVQPFVENAIRHGILKANNKGVLKLHFYTKNTFLYGKITDNGIGIYASQQTKKNTNHQSVALQVTRERLVSLSGNDALQIEELRNEDQTVAGTQIVFKIPLETEF